MHWHPDTGSEEHRCFVWKAKWYFRLGRLTKCRARVLMPLWTLNGRKRDLISIRGCWHSSQVKVSGAWLYLCSCGCCVLWMCQGAHRVVDMAVKQAYPRACTRTCTCTHPLHRSCVWPSPLGRRWAVRAGQMKKLPTYTLGKYHRHDTETRRKVF